MGRSSINWKALMTLLHAMVQHSGQAENAGEAGSAMADPWQSAPAEKHKRCGRQRVS